MSPEQPITCVHCQGTAVPTDSVATYECEDCETRSWIGITNHAREQWATRTDYEADRQLMRYRWEDGRYVPEDPRDWTDRTPSTVPIKNIIGHRFTADEVRFDNRSDVVFLRKDTGIVTVVNVANGRRNLKYSVIQAQLRDRIDAETIADTCQRFGVDTDQLSIASTRQRRREAVLGADERQRDETTASTTEGAAEG